MTYTEYCNQLMAYGSNNCYQAKGGKSLLLNINKGGFISLKPPLLTVEVTIVCSQQIYLLITYVFSKYLMNIYLFRRQPWLSD